MSTLCVSTPASAQEAVLTLDPAKTEIDFNLGDILHRVNGTFKLKSGTIRFDLATGAASGEMIVDATSGDSGSRARDRKMHKEILESQRYPEIVFIPDGVHGQLTSSGDSQVEVHGLFRLHGADHEITLNVRVGQTRGELIATTHLTIPYVEWGLKNPSTFILRVNDKVDVDIRAVGHVSPLQPAKASICLRP